MSIVNTQTTPGAISLKDKPDTAKIVVTMPAYNAAKTLLKTFDEIPRGLVSVLNSLLRFWLSKNNLRADDLFRK